MRAQFPALNNIILTSVNLLEDKQHPHHWGYMRLKAFMLSANVRIPIHRPTCIVLFWPSISGARKTRQSKFCLGSCGLTFTGSDQKMLQCERYEKWCCIDCAGVYSDIQYDLMAPNWKFNWFCDACEINAMSAVATDAHVEERVKVLLWTTRHQTKSSGKLPLYQSR